jgi:RNA polymerase sigma-70 factor (ECF subfamily)
MVLRVCRDTLGNAADAEDAFQATFVVLARRAGAIRCRESVGPWIYGVALRVAACSRKARARRRESDRRVAKMVETNEPDADHTDVAKTVHEEVGRLPENYRAAVVLCYLEGLTHEQAASQLGWPVGTVRSRLAWAREKLRSRLVRRPRPRSLEQRRKAGLSSSLHLSSRQLFDQRWGHRRPGQSRHRLRHWWVLF